MPRLPLIAVLLAGLAWPVAAADLAAMRAAAHALARQAQEARQVVPVQSGDPVVANLQARLGQIEEQIARLTGRIEEAEHRQRQLETRFDTLVGDLDSRLREMEAGGAVAPGGPRPAPADMAGLPPAGAAPPPPAPASPQDSRSLGTVDPRAVPPAPQNWTPPTRDEARSDPQGTYDNALALLRAGNYDAAATALARFVEANPTHPLASNAAYWGAEALYVQGQYAAAAQQFGRNFSTYGPASPKATDNLLKLGMSLGGLGETDKACRTLAELSRVYPDAPAHIKQAVDRERSRLACPS
ncbi:tol-pal system protein YbgF [Marinivivus vitaminiproducens]|uniref:tol-pal system protein YbgF n=1 Tax=Marinivivus vitaminiproducens TaxID=3035935 RepID=UPI00279B41FE|nr:tol-pal system protein YbgF [Geminicoccaceae bacterium SCSIO 64248]